MSQNPSTNRQTISFFWRYTIRYRFHFFLGFINIFQSMINGVLTPLLLGFATAKLLDPSSVSMSFTQIILIIAVSSLLALVINRISLGSINKFETAALQDISDDIAKHLIYESYDFHTKNFGGALINKATKLSASYIAFMDTIMLDVMRNGIIVLVSIIVIALYDLKLAGIVALLAAFGLGSTIIMSRRHSYLHRRSAKNLSDQTAYLADMVTNASSIKTFASEGYELSSYHQVVKKYTKSLLKAWGKQLDANSVRMATAITMNLSVLAYGIYAIQHNLLSAGIFVAALLYCVRITGSFWDITGVVRNLERVFSDAHEMVEIMNQPATLVDDPAAKPLKITKGALSFDHVTFRYDDAAADDVVLDDFTLDIEHGEKIGLVGRSGGGKTTITKLALRFMDIQAGTIAIDGQDISKIPQADLRRSISYVPQEPLLFHRTLEENIAYGDLHANKAAVEKAAQLSHADQFIAQLPKGYQTLVGERGVKLSGGQRQRVAIARAMLKDAPILVLDEATSALDSESELLIQDALWKLMEKRTAIVIAHRLSTIQKMDRIIVLDEGKIVEQGTHKELLQKDGTYASLWKHQSGGFLED